jgi:hypothetical protein
VDRHSPFWQFMKNCLSNRHGISPKHFPLYVKELEFRYNTNWKEFFDRITGYLCDLIPNPESHQIKRYPNNPKSEVSPSHIQHQNRQF